MFFGESHARQSAPQDTVRLSFPEFLEKAKEASNILRARERQIIIAQSRRDEARASRFIPGATATTAHGFIPGVKASDPTLPQDQLYLDPGLRNDWEDWAFFNQLEITAIQPLYTWGAIRNAINAAQSGVRAAEFEYRTEEQNYELQLFQLYQARLLSMELQRLIKDARRQLVQAEDELFRLLDEGDESLEEADVFKFELFKYEFFDQAEQIDQNTLFVERAWRIALGEYDNNTLFLPEENFLDPIEYQHRELDFYMQYALASRPEIHRLKAARDAAEFGLNAMRAQYYPAVILGITGRYAYAPNRPRQRNPFINNPSNTSSVTFGFGFRQNLNFMQLRSRTDRSREQMRQAEFAVEAVQDGIRLDVSDQYRSYLIARTRVENTSEALNVSREWMRMEQLDYDLGFGDVLNLVDAIRSNLELEASSRQRIHDLNVTIAKLYNKAGLPVIELFTN